MAHVIQPVRTEVKIVPRDGEIHITLDVNITVDGKVATVVAEQTSDKKPISRENDTPKFIPDFRSGHKLDFGKKI